VARNYKKAGLVIGILLAVAVIVFVIIRIRIEKDVLVVGYLQISAHAPLIVARDQKILDKYGIEVRLEQFPDTPSLMKAVEGGQVDVGYQLTSDVVFTSASEGRLYYIYLVAQSTKEDPIDGLYAMTNITKESLQGKRIGHFPGPTGAIMTKIILAKQYGLQEGSYQLVPVAPPIQLNMLKSGDIVALFTYEPIGTLAVKKIGAIQILKGPVEELVINGAWNGGIGIFTEELVQRRITTAVSFRNAIYETTQLLEQNKELSAEAMSQLQPGLDRDTALSVPVIKNIMAKNKEEEAELREAIESQISIYRSLGLLKEDSRANIKIFVGQ
jgi:ABC-type nitrate/sulfonate/bicarbonate transport system substrate-binding protein